MRVKRSPSGSFTDMRSSLPARLHEAGDHSLRPEFAQRNAAHLELAIVGARPTRGLATIAHAAFRGVARQLGKLERRGKTLLHRGVLVARDFSQPVAPSRVLIGELCPPLVLLD